MRARLRPAVLVMGALIALATPIWGDDGGLGAVTVERKALVVVNEDTIYTSGLDSVLVQMHKKMTSDQKGAFDYRKLLEKMINDRLLIQEAIRAGLDEDSALLAKLTGNRRQNAIRQFVIDSFKPDLSVGDDSVLAYFTANYGKIQLRTIATREKAEAEQLAAMVVGGASMDSLALAVSLDTYKYRGGLHNLVPLADVEAIMRSQAEPLAAGQLSAVFPYRQAYTFLRVEQRSPADTGELAKYRETILAVLKKRKRDAAWKVFVQNISSRYPVTTDSIVIARIAADSAALFTPNFVNQAQATALQVDAAHEMTESELRTEISRGAMSSGDARFARVMDAGIAAAKDKLIMQAAADAGDFFNNPAVLAQYAIDRDSALVETYLADAVVPKIKFSRAEFQTYYDEHRDDFREPDQIKLDQILVKDEAAANDIIRRLGEGADFSYLAGQYSLQKENEVSKDWSSLLSFPESIRSELAGLKIGQYSRAYNTQEGWVVFRLNDRRPGAPRPLADVEMKVREVMFQRQFKTELDKVLGVLRSGSNIIRNEAEIDRYFQTGK